MFSVVGKENETGGKAEGIKFPMEAQASPTFASAIVKTPPVFNESNGPASVPAEAAFKAGAVPNNKKGKSMSDVVAAVGAYAFFFGVYMPFIIAYAAGGFGKVVEAFKPAYEGAPNVVKFGEADDY